MQKLSISLLLFVLPLAAAAQVQQDSGDLSPRRAAIERPLSVAVHIPAAITLSDPHATAADEAGRRRTGIVRSIAPRLLPQLSDGARGGTFTSLGAAGVRLRIEAAPDTIVLAGADANSLRPFTITPTSDWTPTIAGETAVVYVADGSPATVTDIAHVVELPARPANVACLENALCVDSAMFSHLDVVRRAVAMINFVSGGSAYECSGGLLNDRASSHTAYFLTANHCISSQAAASSIEAVWDYEGACSAATATVGARIVGAQLLVTSASSDVTLLRLNNIPSGRWFLGWDSRPSSVPAGTLIHRFSHPESLSLAYSSSIVETTGGACTGRLRPQFLYSTPYYAATSEGSSGAPVMLDTPASTYVVGQLLGVCGPNPTANCDPFNRNVDGALSASWSLLAPYLDPDAQPACVQNQQTLCLQSSRFAVSVRWTDFGNNSGSGVAVPLTSDTGYFWFFGSANVELVVKVLDGRPLNNRYWVFYGALSTVAYTVTVRDTVTGVVKTYTNPSGNLGSVADTNAFVP
jgi:hypothetical protein